MIPPDELKRLNALQKKFEKGQVILKEGDSTGSLYVIASGLARVEKKSDQAGEKTKTVGILEAGEFFGEMAFINNEPHSATVIADEDTTLYILPRTALEELMKKDPRAALDQALALMSGLSLRLRRTTSEHVAVFETARLIGQSPKVENFAGPLVSQLAGALGSNVSLAFYRWNPFNDEYEQLARAGAQAGTFPQHVDAKSEWLSPKDHLLVCYSQMPGQRDGLFLCLSEGASLDSGQRLLIESISSVVAPALVSARAREEEESLQRLKQGKQERYFA